MQILETERLILRNYAKTDLPDYYKLFSDKLNMYYLPDLITNTIGEARDSLENAIKLNNEGKARRFCITIKETGRFVGGIGYDIEQITPAGKIADPLGWFSLPQFHNMGYMTEAAEKVLEFAFLKDDCVRIVTGCFKENLPTQRVMAKVGFRKEAEKIAAVWLDGMMRDRLEFAVNRDEYIKNT